MPGKSAYGDCYKSPESVIQMSREDDDRSEILDRILAEYEPNLTPADIAALEQIIDSMEPKPAPSGVEASGEMKKGMGTKLAEYGTDGPYSCMNCWYLQSREPRSETLGRCNEPHMMKDPDVEKDEQGLAIVDKVNGCCRYVDPVKHEHPHKKFETANPSKEEEKEHLT